eukprot:Sdes_comp17981_c0_seq1m7243
MDQGRFAWFSNVTPEFVFLSLYSCILTVFSSIFDPHSNFCQDSLLDSIFWWHHVVALVIGCIWGVSGFVGGIFIPLYALALLSSQIFLMAYVLRLDEEDFGGRFELFKEGFMSSFALFLLSWILTYSFRHFD